MSALAVLVQQRLRQFDSLRDASRKLGIGHVYLHRLASGKQANPSDDVLRNLGFEDVTYTLWFTCQYAPHDDYLPHEDVTDLVRTINLGK